jgi:hypothetical protein
MQRLWLHPTHTSKIVAILIVVILDLILSCYSLTFLQFRQLYTQPAFKVLLLGNRRFLNWDEVIGCRTRVA